MGISPIFNGSRLVMEDQLARISPLRMANLSGCSTTNARNRSVFIETALGALTIACHSGAWIFCANKSPGAVVGTAPGGGKKEAGYRLRGMRSASPGAVVVREPAGLTENAMGSGR